MMATRDVILEYVGAPAAIVVAMDLCVLAQLRPELLDAVPELAEQLLCHGLGDPGPDQQVEPIDQAVCPDPDQAAPVGLDLGEPFHAGTQQRRGVLES